MCCQQLRGQGHDFNCCDVFRGSVCDRWLQQHAAPPQQAAAWKPSSSSTRTVYAASRRSTRASPLGRRTTSPLRASTRVRPFRSTGRHPTGRMEGSSSTSASLAPALVNSRIASVAASRLARAPSRLQLYHPAQFPPSRRAVRWVSWAVCLTTVFAVTGALSRPRRIGHQ